MRCHNDVLLARRPSRSNSRTCSTSALDTAIAASSSLTCAPPREEARTIARDERGRTPLVAQSPVDLLRQALHSREQRRRLRAHIHRRVGLAALATVVDSRRHPLNESFLLSLETPGQVGIVEAEGAERAGEAPFGAAFRIGGEEFGERVGEDPFDTQVLGLGLRDRSIDAGFDAVERGSVSVGDQRALGRVVVLHEADRDAGLGSGLRNRDGRQPLSQGDGQNRIAELSATGIVIGATRHIGIIARGRQNNRMVVWLSLMRDRSSIRIAKKALFAIAAWVMGALVIGLSPTAWATREGGGAYVEQVRAELGLPGLAVQLRDASGTHTWVAGESASEEPLTASTPQLIGSVSKSFTATATQVLVSRGMLGLDDEVGHHLPYIAHPGITVRDLMRHTSGYSTAAGLAHADRFDTSPGALDRAARDVVAEAPTGERGRFSYSDANYLLLGAVVEEVAGAPFGEVLQQEVAAPLGLSDASFTAESARGSTGGHRSMFGCWAGFDRGYDESGVPYGYVVSSLDDLSRYVQAHRTGAGLPLGRDARLAMQSPQVTTGDRWYGYGWRGIRAGDHEVIEHTGATPGTFTHVAWLPEHDTQVVVMTGAYSESRAQQLTSIAYDLLRHSADGQPLPAGSSGAASPLLTWAPFTSAAVAAFGLALCAWAIRGAATSRPRRGRFALLLGATAAGTAVAALLTPDLVGFSGRTLRLWAPDLGWSLIAITVTWALLSACLAAQAHRAPPGGTRSPATEHT